MSSQLKSINEAFTHILILKKVQKLRNILPIRETMTTLTKIQNLMKLHTE